jgi:hypothetical protein
MRTTLDLDDDILLAAKELAKRQRRTAGQVISGLVRAALAGEVGPAPPSEAAFLGFRPFPRRDGVRVTNDEIDRLREEGEY